MSKQNMDPEEVGSDLFNPVDESVPEDQVEGVEVGDDKLTPPERKEPKITSLQQQVLDHLQANGATRVCALCKALGKGQPHMHGILKALASKGKVKQVTQEDGIRLWELV